MSMVSGDLRRRIVIQKRIETQDAFGQRLTVWTDKLAGLTMGSTVAISAVSSGPVTTLTSAAHGLSSGALVRLAGVNGMNCLPCTFGVLGPTTNTFDVGFDTSSVSLTLASATWRRMSGVPAAIEQLRPTEQLAGQAIKPGLTTRITVRWHSQLVEPLEQEDLRALYVDHGVPRYFHLQAAVNENTQDQFLSFLAAEAAP